MNKLSFKKFLPGLVSVIIIAGMAVQSFATNIDLAAFVNKDKYMTKYYELDWRIKDVKDRLDRMYKFTCKNVKTFAGTTPQTIAPVASNPFYFNNFSASYIGWNYYTAFFDDPKAIRVSTRYALTYGGAQGGIGGTYKVHTNTFKKEYPASLCKWRDGFELLPTTKVSITINDRVTGASTNNMNTEIIMGPFKKVPKYTTVGQQLTQGYICEFPHVLFNSSWNWQNVMSYNYGTETKPTSWTTFGSNVYTYIGTVNAGQNTLSKYPTFTRADIENGNMALGKALRGHSELWFNNAVPADISNRTNVWLRLYYSYDSTSNLGTFANLGEMNFTNWNNNK